MPIQKISGTSFFPWRDQVQESRLVQPGAEYFSPEPDSSGVLHQKIRIALYRQPFPVEGIQLMDGVILKSLTTLEVKAPDDLTEDKAKKIWVFNALKIMGEFSRCVPNSERHRFSITANSWFFLYVDYVFRTAIPLDFLKTNNFGQIAPTARRAFENYCESFSLLSHSEKSSSGPIQVANLFPNFDQYAEYMTRECERIQLYQQLYRQAMASDLQQLRNPILNPALRLAYYLEITGPLIETLKRFAIESKIFLNLLRGHQSTPQVKKSSRVWHDFNNVVAILLAHHELYIEQIQNRKIPDFKNLMPMEDLSDVFLFLKATARLSKLNVRVDLPEDLKAFKSENRRNMNDLLDLLLNPVTNAIKHANPRNRHLVDLDLTARRQGDEIVFGVQDNGAGMTPETISRYFLLDTKTMDISHQPTGHGIGARGAARLAMSLGGSVHVESNIGAGTYVETRLPASLFKNPEPKIQLATHNRDTPTPVTREARPADYLTSRDWGLRRAATRRLSFRR